MAIHWKTNYNPGVVIADGIIRDWPESLGEMPTEEQIVVWMDEYQAYIAATDAAEEARKTAINDAIIAALPAWPIVKAAINNAFPDIKQNNFMTAFCKAVYAFITQKKPA